MQYEESYTVELKQEINADFKKEIIAFANSEGGEIFVGVDRNGGVVGVTDAEKVMEQIGNMIRDMLRESDGVTFDSSRCINQELTFMYADGYFAASHIPFGDSNKKTLKLIDSDGYYTNTALLLSDQCEHSIKCAVYEGTGKTKFKMRKEFFGSVLKQMDEAYDFLTLNNNLNSTIGGLKRTDHPDYPPFE